MLRTQTVPNPRQKKQNTEGRKQTLKQHSSTHNFEPYGQVLFAALLFRTQVFLLDLHDVSLDQCIAMTF